MTTTTLPDIRLIIDERPLPGDELCFDADAPFDVRHVGKLAIPPYLQAAELYDDYKAPRHHCVVDSGEGSRRRIVRYTPEQYYQSLADIVRSSDLMAELHELHLKKLGEFGLHPWYTDIAPGNHSYWAFERRGFEGRGLYVMQNMLPKEAEIGLRRNEDRIKQVQRVSQYYNWVRNTNQPGRMRDTDRGDQCSIVDGEIVLHDIEPLYTTVIP